MTSNETTNASIGNDKVGYGNPPTHTRFPKGRSGNQNGRPKGTKNLKTDLTEELAERIRVTENGKQVRLSKQRIMLKALTAKAMKGDTKAANTLIGLIAQTVGLDTRDEKSASLSTEDDAILADWLAHNMPAATSNDAAKPAAAPDESISTNESEDDDDWLS